MPRWVHCIIPHWKDGHISEVRCTTIPFSLLVAACRQMFHLAVLAQGTAQEKKLPIPYSCLVTQEPCSVRGSFKHQEKFKTVMSYNSV